MDVFVVTGRVMTVLIYIIVLFKFGHCGDYKIALIAREHSNSDPSLYDAAVSMGKDKVSNLSTVGILANFLEINDELKRGYGYISAEAYFINQVKGIIILGKLCDV